MPDERRSARRNLASRSLERSPGNLRRGNRSRAWSWLRLAPVARHAIAVNDGHPEGCGGAADDADEELATTAASGLPKNRIRRLATKARLDEASKRFPDLGRCRRPGRQTDSVDSDGKEGGVGVPCRTRDGFESWIVHHRVTHHVTRTIPVGTGLVFRRDFRSSPTLLLTTRRFPRLGRPDPRTLSHPGRGSCSFWRGIPVPPPHRSPRRVQRSCAI
jgi:hypothetical protein